MKPEPSDSERLISLEGRVQGLEAGVNRIFGELKEISASLNSKGRINWGLIVSGIAALVTVISAVIFPTIGAIYLFASLQSQTQLAALRSQDIAPLSAASELSKRDRGEIRAAVELNAMKISAGEQMDARTMEMLREIETQVKLIHDTANQRDVHYWQILSLLWKKSYGEDLPVYPYQVHPKQMP